MGPAYYAALARQGLRMPIGADLVLHEQASPEEVRRHPEQLGRIVAEAARRYRTPLAIPLMDLRLDKAALLAGFGIEAATADSFHFDSAPEAAALAAPPWPEENLAQMGAVRWVAEREPDLVAAGMAIGPFSLMTKLVADPIAPVALAGQGLTGEDDPGIALVERCLALAEAAIARGLMAQIEAGAKAVLICEPAANRVYLSPKQLRAGADTFRRYVLEPNLRLKSMLDRAGVDLVFHNCGELIPEMVRDFGHVIHPAILSLGSSRKLWEDAALLPDDVVLFGNLPTKLFYSDAEMPEERVQALTEELRQRMAACGRAHILGSECDVLHVDGAGDRIRRKVDVMLGAA